MGKSFAGFIIIVHPKIKITTISQNEFLALQSSKTLFLSLFANKNSWYFDTDTTIYLCNAGNISTSYIKFTIPQAIKGISGYISFLANGMACLIVQFTD